MSGIIDSNRKLIAGFGSALVDILIHETDDFLSSCDAAKGGMVLVENERIQEILAKSAANPLIVPGGSACNTIIGIACLGGTGRFIGKCGEDDFGTLFQTDLKENGVAPLLLKSQSPTGRVLSIITPDAQRTMLTYLGASSETDPSEITEEFFRDAAIVHIEGYLLFNQDLMLAALNAAKQAGAYVSLDLASFTVVEQSKDFLNMIVDEFVDILIANEDEARVFTGYSDEDEAISALSKRSEIAVLKLGKKGSIISEKGNVIRIKPKGTGDAVDTTGAGDLWASGFLYGLVNGYSYENCGTLGSACGYEVCQVVGASIPKQGWERIRPLV